MRKILLIISLVIVLMITTNSFYSNEDRAQEFLSQYVSHKIATYVLKWSSYYELDWLNVFSTLMAESEGKVRVKSRKGNIGLMQISRHLVSVSRPKFKGKIKNRNAYSPEFNIASGCLHLSAVRNSLQKDKEKDWAITYGIYNAGRKGFYVKKYQIGGAINRFVDTYAFYKMEWQKF